MAVPVLICGGCVKRGVTSPCRGACVCVGARQVTLPSSLTLAHLKARVYELSRVAPDRQKLLGLPKTLVDDSLLSVVVSVVGVGVVGWRC